MYFPPAGSLPKLPQLLGLAMVKPGAHNRIWVCHLGIRNTSTQGNDLAHYCCLPRAHQQAAGSEVEL